jgi:hypothetical protein
MSKVRLRRISGGALAGALLAVSPAIAAAEPETLVYARYLDERTASSGIEKIRLAQQEGLDIRAGSVIARQTKGRLKVKKWRAKSVTAAAVVDGLIGVLSMSPGRVQSCPDWEEAPLSLNACPEAGTAYVTLATVGVPKETVMRIRNSFPWWHSGYSADEAAITLVIPQSHLQELVSRLRKTQVVEIVAYTIPSYLTAQAQDLLQPPTAASPR